MFNRNVGKKLRSFRDSGMSGLNKCCFRNILKPAARF